tara:strand:- start:144 stop:407 length:264 start_codon:yes stop_codon:yes gene_type:complete
MKEVKNDNEEKDIEKARQESMENILEMLLWGYNIGFKEGKDKTVKAMIDVLVENAVKIKPDLEGFMNRIRKIYGVEEIEKNMKDKDE